MSVPSFSRVEICHDDAEDISTAVTELMALSGELSRIFSEIEDQNLMRLAAHAAIRDTSKKLRRTSK